MVADRVPQPGEVWVFRHLRPHGHGYVVVIEVVDDGRVVYEHVSTSSPGARELPAFVRMYEFVAASTAEWAFAEGVTS